MDKKKYLNLIKSLQNLVDLVQDATAEEMIRKETKEHRKLDRQTLIANNLQIGKSYPAKELLKELKDV